MVELWVTFPKFDQYIYFSFFGQIPKFDPFQSLKIIVQVSLAFYFSAENMVSNIADVKNHKFKINLHPFFTSVATIV